MPRCRLSESAERRRVTVCIGMTQLINWGAAFYLPGVFCAAIAADRGWSPTLAFSGAMLALVVMGCLSPYAGWLLDRVGGRRVMMLGAASSAAGCLLMAASTGMADYFIAWVMLGVGMRLSLYEAAFATLVALYGGEARRAISLVTLFGGISSSLFWPLGMTLLHGLGWRWGVAIYGVIVLSGLLWLWALPQPASRLSPRTEEQAQTSPSAGTQAVLPAVLYALLMTLFSFLSAGISAHLLAILTGFGVSASLGALWGVGQVCARVGDVDGRTYSGVETESVAGGGVAGLFSAGAAGRAVADSRGAVCYRIRRGEWTQYAGEGGIAAGIVRPGALLLPDRAVADAGVLFFRRGAVGLCGAQRDDWRSGRPDVFFRRSLSDHPDCVVALSDAPACGASGSVTR
ncbi:MFS transporter [Dickeya dadantii subsp. dieffenbachiae]|uniref:MFS transporter n=1 Tax=Dickeya dadantii TaxID=204038 RepID=UPI001F01758B|nr:MFS transporter [Dickeya dadantii]